MPGMWLRDDGNHRRHHSRNRTCPLLRQLSIGFLASAIAMAPLPIRAQDGTAEALGDVMSFSIDDVVKRTIGFQGALQGASTPNQAGIGGFLPLSVGDNSFGTSMPWSMPRSVTAMERAASSIPM